jgi:hypothetical protein
VGLPSVPPPWRNREHERTDAVRVPVNDGLDPVSLQGRGELPPVEHPEEDLHGNRLLPVEIPLGTNLRSGLHMNDADPGPLIHGQTYKLASQVPRQGRGIENERLPGSEPDPHALPPLLQDPPLVGSVR